VRVGKEAAHLPIRRFGRRFSPLPKKKSKEKGLKGTNQYTVVPVDPSPMGRPRVSRRVSLWLYRTATYEIRT
jgi:hypothetical protein